MADICMSTQLHVIGKASNMTVAKYLMLILMLQMASMCVAQEKREDVCEKGTLESLVSRMPEKSRQQYERLREGKFAKVELAPRLPELDEAAGKLTEPYKVGSKIYFRLLITNISTLKVVIDDSDDYYNNRPELLRDENLIPYRQKTIELLKSRDQELVHRRLRAASIEANEELEERIELDDWYDTLQPGHYQLRVRRRFIWCGEWIESSSINFDVAR